MSGAITNLDCELMIDVDYTDLTRPVEQVSWDDAVAYCAALTEPEREAGRIAPNYRVPRCPGPRSVSGAAGGAVRSRLAQRGTRKPCLRR
jgi:hypothetical protein